MKLYNLQSFIRASQSAYVCYVLICLG